MFVPEELSLLILEMRRTHNCTTGLVSSSLITVRNKKHIVNKSEFSPHIVFSSSYYCQNKQQHFPIGYYEIILHNGDSQLAVS